MLVKPSAFTNSRLESEYWHSTPSFGFQLGGRFRCARTPVADTAAEILVSRLRLERVTKRRYCAARHVASARPQTAKILIAWRKLCSGSCPAAGEYSCATYPLKPVSATAWAMNR